jgi:hypothetical protein
MAIVGNKGVLYFLSTGTRSLWGGSQGANGAWVNTPPSGLLKVGGITDVEEGLSSTNADTSNRDNIPFETGLAAMLKGPLTFKGVYKATDPGQEALFKAWYAQTSIALCDLDQASSISGAVGIWGDFSITDIKKSGPIKGIYTLDVTATPYDSGVVTQLVQVS